VSRFAYFLFSTPGAELALAIAVVALALRPRSIRTRRVALAVTVAYLLVSVYAVPTAVANLLARPYHQFERDDVPSGRVALVIFGAGDEEVAGWDVHLAVSNTVGAARVLEAWRVYQIAHPEWIVSSGGNPNPDAESEPSGVNMRNLLVQLGVPASKIVAESASRETHENALASAAIVRSLHADHVILVTSAVHMRRSMGAMNAAGIAATPAIAPDSWFRNDAWDDWVLPSNHALYFSGEVVHELLGLPYYRLRGWLR